MSEDWYAGLSDDERATVDAAVEAANTANREWLLGQASVLDKLAEAGVEVISLDDAKRAEMYQRMQDIMEDSGAYRFITHEATPVIYRNSVKPAFRPDGLPLLRYFMPA